MYIYIVYIQCKRKMCKKGKVPYGYPMGMVWVSYGKTTHPAVSALNICSC